MMRDVLVDWLRDKGHQVAAAASGIEASKLIAGSTFDLLITDIIMPDQDGIELIRQVRVSSPATGIIAISAGNRFLSAKTGLDIAKSLGADFILPKPFNQEQLLEAIAAVCPADIYPRGRKADAGAS